jgi:hypothetical protein
MAKIGKCSDFNPNSQSVGGVKGAMSGGSKMTPQVLITSFASNSNRSHHTTTPSSKPSSPQKLRG